MTDEVSAPIEAAVDTSSSNDAVQANPNQPTANEVQNAAAGELFTVVIDGQRQQVTKEELLSGYQKASASDKKYREAQSLTGQAEQLLELLQKNPRYVLQNMGVDIGSLTNEYLHDVIQEELMSPEQRELRTYKQRLSQYEEAQRRYEEEQYLIQQEAAAEQYTNQIVSELTTAMEGSGLNKRQSQKIMQEAAKYKMALIEAGKGDIPIGAIAKKLINDYRNTQTEMLSQGDINYLTQLLGKDKVNQIVRAQTKAMQAMPQSAAPMVSRNGTPKKDKERISKKDLNPWKL